MRVSDELVRALGGIGTSTLANALDAVGFEGVVDGLAPVIPGMRCAGRAVTVLETTAARGSFSSPEFRVGEMIDAAGPGDLVVVANAGACVSTWGGTAALAAKLRAIGGLVVDGGVRDRAEIAEAGFPVFARHVTPRTGRTRVRVEAIGAPVSVAGVRVEPGDVVVADDTGIVVVPARHAREVLETARRLAAEDAEARRALEAGATFSEVMRRFGGI